MNYRHAFHAGNHADVLKHALLHLALDHLFKKPKPIVAIDAFAGGGLVDLQLDDRAARTGEWRSGAGLVWDAGDRVASALGAYRAALARRNTEPQLRYMPGSPLQILDRLRPGDKLLAVEKHPEEVLALRRALAGDARARAYQQDGWRALGSFLPPTPRRGLALIDPPFEERGEYDRLAQALQSGLRRWATGVFLLWAPLKDPSEATAYERALIQAAGDTPLLFCELKVRPAGEPGLIGSSVAVANPPFGFAERASTLGASIAALLSAAEEPWRCETLIASR